MTITIRAIVENGALRPLDPVELVEGQEMEIIITDDSFSAQAMDNQLSLFSAMDDESLL